MKDIATTALLGIVIGLVMALCAFASCCEEGPWMVTAYSDRGRTASGIPAQYAVCACNWLPFGTNVEIEGLGRFVVADRGSKRMFGDMNRHIRHLDIWMESGAKEFGVQWRKVRFL